MAPAQARKYRRDGGCIHGPRQRARVPLHGLSLDGQRAFEQIYQDGEVYCDDASPTYGASILTLKSTSRLTSRVWTLNLLTEWISISYVTLRMG
jgi:hypothetical protein